MELQRAKEENQRLRQSLGDATDDALPLKAGREVLEDPAKKSAGDPAKPEGAAAKTEESWPRRLFPSR